MTERFLDDRVTLLSGDCLALLDTLPDNSIDSVVCDPPYHLTSIVKRFGADDAAPTKIGKTGAYVRASSGFMGKKWDGGDIAFRVETWTKVLRVLKPGGHLLAFSGTRTYHRMTCAIEDAGFEIRDCIQWLYGSGFPKSHDVSKGIDRTAGAERKIIGQERNFGATKLRDGKVGYGDYAGEWSVTTAATESAKQWEGWGTALKPACEPIVLARKPLSESTVAANVLRWGTGAINVNGCKIETDEEAKPRHNVAQDQFFSGKKPITQVPFANGGRWPANLIHDGSAEVVEAFPETGASQSGGVAGWQQGGYVGGKYVPIARTGYDEPAGSSAARFFYAAKADSDDRLGSKHPTVKPLDLMQYLVRLVTPKGGVVLDPFAGTGTTGEAAWREGCSVVLIEAEAEYQNDIRRRMALALAGPDEKQIAIIKAKGLTESPGPLFNKLEAAE
jgi:DNA modification methylase